MSTTGGGHLLCRNRVADFAAWKRVFDSHAGAHRAAGLTLLHLWREPDDPASVFFLFAIESRERALAFVSAPEAAAAGRASGVLEGEVHFLAEE